MKTSAYVAFEPQRPQMLDLPVSVYLRRRRCRNRLNNIRWSRPSALQDGRFDRATAILIANRAVFNGGTALLDKETLDEAALRALTQLQRLDPALLAWTIERCDSSAFCIAGYALKARMDLDRTSCKRTLSKTRCQNMSGAPGTGVRGTHAGTLDRGGYAERVALAISGAEMHHHDEMARAFPAILSDFRFLPWRADTGQCRYLASSYFVRLFCRIQAIEDSVSGAFLMRCAKLMLTLQSGGETGVDFSVPGQRVLAVAVEWQWSARPVSFIKV